MAGVFFGADLHLGHRNIATHRKDFKSQIEHEEYMLDMVSEYVSKRSIIYLLGDICFTVDAIHELAKLNTNGNMRIILGNHDTERTTITDWVNAGFDKIHGMMKYKEFWLSHPPIHDSELRGKFNIYGHTHYAYVDDPRYRCVSMEQVDYKLISLDELRNEFAVKFPEKRRSNR